MVIASRSAAIVIWLLTGLLLVQRPDASGAERAETGPEGVAGLEDRLKTGLRVKAPREVAFVETVARRVREGRLPEHVVDSTYLWAVRRGKKYPFPAFEHVIRLKAERLGVSLE